MYYIGIDLGGTNIKGALVSETGEIAREVSRPTRVELGAEAVCDGIAAVITELSSGVDRTSLGGVGLGCPGTVDDETGRVLYANNLGWKNFDLRAAVKSRTGFDLRIGNDANVAALAEVLVGCAKGAQSAVIVTLGTGVGGGVVLDGKMLTGYTGAASELGHMVIRAGGEECTCGRRGCFEAYASATALIRETKRAMAAHPESRMHAAAEENGAVDGRTAFIAAQRGDAAAQAVVDRYLDDLACGVANIVNIFFPEVIALSGGVANQGDTLLVPLRERVRALSYGSRYAVRHTRIELCTLGYRAGVIGAAAFKQDASFFPDGFQFFLGKKRPKIQQCVGCGAQRPRQRAQQQNIRVGTGRLPFGHRRGGNAHGLGKLFLRQSLLSAQCLDGFSGWHFHFGKFLSFLLGPVPS